MNNTNLTKTQLKILSYLIDNQEKLLGIRELAKRISVVYYLVHRNIKDLQDRKIIEITKAGKTNIITISKNADTKYLEKAERFKKDIFYKKHPQIKIILNKIIDQSETCFFILLVFGSYAKQQSRKDSDLDLLVIIPNNKEVEIIEKVISSISRTSIIKIHDTVITGDSFKKMINKKELNIGIEAKEKHILIYGHELFYKMIR